MPSPQTNTFDSCKVTKTVWTFFFFLTYRPPVILLADYTVKMTSITLFSIYRKLIIRPSLLNLTRLKYHKKYIWQFRKYNQGKGKMNISEDK